MWPSVAAIQPADARWILVSGAILALLIVVGGVGVWYYRKRVLFPDTSSAGTVWTFDDLRRMRERGELTEEEYQSLRAALIGSFQGKSKKEGLSDGLDPQGVSRDEEPRF